MQVPASPQYMRWDYADEAKAQPLGTNLRACVPTPPGSGNNTDAELLLAFKASYTNGDTVLADWQQGTNPCSGWTGVLCDNNGRVAEL